MLLRSDDMVKRIRIEAGSIEALAELNDTGTAQAIWEALPIRGQASLWGDEIYFSIPVSMGLEKGQEVVNAGDLGYWPQGKAFCIFFGPTPVSQGNEIRPASSVTVFGRVTSNTTLLKEVAVGEKIIIDRVIHG
jgi:hypothetical protein